MKFTITKRERKREKCIYYNYIKREKKTERERYTERDRERKRENS